MPLHTAVYSARFRVDYTRGRDPLETLFRNVEWKSGVMCPLAIRVRVVARPPRRIAHKERPVHVCSARLGQLVPGSLTRSYVTHPRPCLGSGRSPGRRRTSPSLVFCIRPPPSRPSLSAACPSGAGIAEEVPYREDRREDGISQTPQVRRIDELDSHHDR